MRDDDAKLNSSWRQRRAMKAGVLNMAFCIHKGTGLVCMHAWGFRAWSSMCCIFVYTDKWERVLSNKTFSLIFDEWRV